MTTYPGDPLTPGIGATANAKRLSRAQAKTILKIPALPISYGDAARIIAGLEGPVVTGTRQAAGSAWRIAGGGTDKVKVHLAVKSDWALKPVYDVIATMKGSTYPDQWVIRGNHHDAWVFGASDPLTGNVGNDVGSQGIGCARGNPAGARSGRSSTPAGTARSQG